MTEESVKCPICGTKNTQESETCAMCKSRLAKKENGRVSVKSPKPRAKTHVMIDIEDPLTRKKLEELTLIPGVTRRKALILYQSGIHSMEDFLMKAFQGERFSTNYTRTVANKLLVQSMGKKKKNAEIQCPSCNANNPIASKKCKVCNFDIESDMKSLDMKDISGKLNDSVKEILNELKDSEDFESLPEDMKAQFAAVIGSDDIDFEMEKPKEMESLGIDIEKIDEDVKEITQEIPDAKTDKQNKEAPKEEPTKAPKKETEQAPSKPKEGPGDKKVERQDKIRNILLEKLVKWRKSGYDVSELETYLDDVEGFKTKAKEVLGNGKIVKLRCLKQVEMWREKGFEVSELEKILETDIDLFQEKAKEILKKQKK